MRFFVPTRVVSWTTSNTYKYVRTTTNAQILCHEILEAEQTKGFVNPYDLIVRQQNFKQWDVAQDKYNSISTFERYTHGYKKTPEAIGENRFDRFLYSPLYDYSTITEKSISDKLSVIQFDTSLEYHGYSTVLSAAIAMDDSKPGLDTLDVVGPHYMKVMSEVVSDYFEYTKPSNILLSAKYRNYRRARAAEVNRFDGSWMDTITGEASGGVSILPEDDSGKLIEVESGSALCKIHGCIETTLPLDMFIPGVSEEEEKEILRKQNAELRTAFDSIDVYATTTTGATVIPWHTTIIEREYDRAKKRMYIYFLAMYDPDDFKGLVLDKSAYTEVGLNVRNKFVRWKYGVPTAESITVYNADYVEHEKVDLKDRAIGVGQMIS